MALQEQFHCILIANLELKLPYGKDTISVWKRTKYVPARIYSTHDGCNHSNSSLESLSHDGSSGYLAGRTDSDMDDDSGSDGDLQEDDGQDSEEKGEDEDEDDESEGDDNEEEEECSEPLTVSAADAVTYMSISDLNKLRNCSELKAPKSKTVSQLIKEGELARRITGYLCE